VTQVTDASAWTDCGAGRHGLYFVDARICTDCGAIMPRSPDNVEAPAAARITKR
jgi:hypothetical protein